MKLRKAPKSNHAFTINCYHLRDCFCNGHVILGMWGCRLIDFSMNVRPPNPKRNMVDAWKQQYRFDYMRRDVEKEYRPWIRSSADEV